MVTGHKAFGGDTRASVMASILKDEPKPARALAEALPRELERIILRCLRKDLERRSQSMAEIKLALEELKEESEIRRATHGISRRRAAFRPGLCDSVHRRSGVRARRDLGFQQGPPRGRAGSVPLAADDPR
jgi:hypothetical protein